MDNNDFLRSAERLVGKKITVSLHDDAEVVGVWTTTQLNTVTGESRMVLRTPDGAVSAIPAKLITKIEPME